MNPTHCDELHLPFPHTRILPLESPVMVSPFSEKVTHRTNLGFSCFCRFGGQQRGICKTPFHRDTQGTGWATATQLFASILGDPTEITGLETRDAGGKVGYRERGGLSQVCPPLSMSHRLQEHPNLYYNPPAPADASKLQQKPKTPENPSITTEALPTPTPQSPRTAPAS